MIFFWAFCGHQKKKEAEMDMSTTFAGRSDVLTPDESHKTWKGPLYRKRCPTKKKCDLELNEIQYLRFNQANNTNCGIFVTVTLTFYLLRVSSDVKVADKCQWLTHVRFSFVDGRRTVWKERLVDMFMAFVEKYEKKKTH